MSARRLLDFDVLSFDCYGTLIDWETGLLEAVRLHLPEAPADEDRVLEAFGRFEAEEEQSTPGAPYPEILERVHRRLAEHWELRQSTRHAKSFASSVGDWPAFPDSPAALAVLRRHFRLVVLSNVDRDSFEASRQRLRVDFAHVFTAEDIGSYKPDPRNFEHMLERLGEQGVERGGILHVAQSLYHDHEPAARLGLATCWIDRRHDKDGWGATKAPASEVDVDFRYPSLVALADAVEAEAGSA